VGAQASLKARTGRVIAELTDKELRDEKANLPEYREWHKQEGEQYYSLLDTAARDPDISEDEMFNFKYLQAIFCLNTFFGFRIEPEGYFEDGNEKICSDAIGRGGDITDMLKKGAEALYCALLSNASLDKDILLKTVAMHIPF
jgi:hypothetical protein